MYNNYVMKAKRNKGMKNAGHGLNPGCRYWCHASNSLTERSGPAATQRAHISISLHHGLQLALMAQSGSHWHDTNSGIQGSSHGWLFSSLCFSLLSLHICTRTHSFSFKYTVEYRDSAPPPPTLY